MTLPTIGIGANIVRHVAKEFGLRPADVIGPKQSKPIARGRQLCMWLLRHETQHSYSMIGRVISRDHTTVVHGVNAITERMESDEALKAKAEALRSQIRNAPWFPAAWREA